jgi:hypothetical protein
VDQTVKPNVLRATVDAVGTTTTTATVRAIVLHVLLAPHPVIPGAQRQAGGRNHGAGLRVGVRRVQHRSG